MKQKLKAIAGGIAIIMLLFLNSCEKDSYDENLSEGEVKMLKVSLKDPNVLVNRNLMKEVQKIKLKKRKGSANSKMVYDSINDFYFDDENGILIEKDNGYKSYTFEILRDEPSEELENIVFNLKEDGSYEAIKMTYNLTEIEKEKLVKNEPFTLNVLPELSILNKNIAVKCNSIVDQCSTGVTRDGELIFIVTYADPCPDGSGGGGNGGVSGGGNSSGGNSSSGGYTPLEPLPGSGTSGQNDSVNNGGGGTVTTTPVGGGNSSATTTTAKNPCETLNDACNDPKVDKQLNILKTKAAGMQEFAAEIERRSSDITVTGASFNTIAHSGSNYGVSVPYGEHTQGQAHNHPINGIAIPSWNDVYWTQLCEEENSPFNDGSAFNIIVSPDPNNDELVIIYSITIDDIAILQQATNAVFNLPEIVAEPDEQLKRNAIMNLFGSKFSPHLCSPDEQVTTFLKTFATYGITLSKFNQEAYQWEKLKLNANNEVTKEPCI